MFKLNWLGANQEQRGLPLEHDRHGQHSRIWLLLIWRSGTFSSDAISTLFADQLHLVLFRRLAALSGITLLSVVLPAPSTQAKGSLFRAVPVDANKFVLVAAPVGRGERSQLNIYEQRGRHRPCYSVSDSKPAVVNPLLASFDFTGFCRRYIDANGYSLRIGADDLGTHYRFSVVKRGGDIELLASPTRDQFRPTFTVARAGGDQPGFIQFNLEQGWRLMRRAYGNQSLGHLYLYRDALAAPGSESESTAVPLIRSQQSSKDRVPLVQVPAPSKHQWSAEVLVDAEDDESLNWPYLNH